jgi:hypothetical protein
MGKFFNALEKFERERLVASVKPKLTKADYLALLKFDRVTGKLDLYDRDIVTDIETPQRLLDNNLIYPNGKLSPAGLSLCEKYRHRKVR